VRWNLSPPAGLIAPDGIYTAPAFIDTAQTVKVTAAGVTSAATFINGAVAPGEIVTIFGTNIGPEVLDSLQLTSDGKVSAKVGGTKSPGKRPRKCRWYATVRRARRSRFP
jgi:hypothetical protein